jgi:hypothetical protein
MSEAFLISRHRMPSPPSHAISALTVFLGTREALWARGETQEYFQVDRTGPGLGLAVLLVQRVGKEFVVALRCTRPTKSHLTEQWLAMSNSGRLKMDQADEAPTIIYEEAWKQLRLARDRA